MKQVVVLSICLVLVPVGSSLAGDPKGESAIGHMPISVWNISGIESRRPVTGGVPLAQGAAPQGVLFALCDANDNPVPLQTSVLSRWKDRSARWVLLDFQAEPPANTREHFKLCWGKKLKAANPEFPVEVNRQDRLSIGTRNVIVSPLRSALLRISDRVDLGLTLIDGEGRKCTAIVESVDVQTEGEIRSTLLLRGAFRDPDGRRVFGFRVLASVFAGLSKVYLEPQILIDSENGVVQHLRDLKFAVTPLVPMRSATIGGTPKWTGTSKSKVRLFQVDDENYRFEGARGSGSKAQGWAEMNDGRGTIAIALRDFWQQWPKSIEVDSEGLAIGLFPGFAKGTFDHMEPWYKHQYLFKDNYYRLRTGQAPRWRIWLDLSGRGSSLVQAANAPLVPSADPAQAIASGVWGSIDPAGGPDMKRYDDWAENLFDNGYCRSIRVQRDYGQMNWGDWFGERRCNWGNHEYDTAKHILVQFARTGDPKYLYVGDVAARHTSEIDVIHFANDDLTRHFEEDFGGRSAYPVRPGMVHEHCVGHVSGFYDVERIRELYASLGNGSHLCLAPYNLGHIWTQGMVYDYFLTGNPWVKETVEKIGNNLARLAEDRKFNFRTGTHVGRVNGWTMLAIAGAYELDLDERYLKAMKLLADDAISAQDPHCGGWLWKLPGDHCYCETKHIGEAGFIGSVRINGLCRYYELSGDGRIPEVVKRAVTHLNNDTWMEQHSDWRYTSCPASGRVGQTGVTIAALVNSVKLNGEPEHLRILRKAWDGKFERLLIAPTSRPGLGKTYSMIMYGSPEAMNLFVGGF
ncbi:MAG: hypothetical protein JSW66_09790 [Phycisphaerales bacterium]|nr:MAG: hypothetical protein JSW66_09790 [Phycisphaerales bacterium]